MRITDEEEHLMNHAITSYQAIQEVLEDPDVDYEVTVNGNDIRKLMSHYIWLCEIRAMGLMYELQEPH